MADVPLLDGVVALANEGFVTGASERNWASYGDAVQLAPVLSGTDRALLCDPQTSGGLLIACASDALQAVLEIFGGTASLGPRASARWSRERLGSRSTVERARGHALSGSAYQRMERRMPSGLVQPVAPVIDVVDVTASSASDGPPRTPP